MFSAGTGAPGSLAARYPTPRPCESLQYYYRQPLGAVSRGRKDELLQVLLNPSEDGITPNSGAASTALMLTHLRLIPLAVWLDQFTARSVE
jgi:hypothetical protein